MHKVPPHIRQLEIELWNRACKGDNDAKGALLMLHRPKLHRYLVRFVQPADADDILQDLFERMVRKFDLYVCTGYTYAYMWRVMRNAMISLHHVVELHKGKLERHVGDIRDLMAQDMLGPDEIADLRLQRDLVLKYAECLPKRRWERVLRWTLAGETPEDMASRWGTGVTVEQARRRADCAAVRMKEMLWDG